MLDLWQVLSFVWYLYYRCTPGEWLVAIGMAWWGLIKYAHFDVRAAQVWWGLSVLILLLGWLAKAMDYVVFRPTDEARAAWTAQNATSVRGVAAGHFLHPSDPFLRIPVMGLRVKEPVLVHWYGGDRPPVLGVLAPASVDPRNQAIMDHVTHWSMWYPGAQVRKGTAYIAGSCQPGLELSFVGRRMVVALADEEAADAIETVMAENA